VLTPVLSGLSANAPAFLQRGFPEATALMGRCYGQLSHVTSPSTTLLRLEGGASALFSKPTAWPARPATFKTSAECTVFHRAEAVLRTAIFNNRTDCRSKSHLDSRTCLFRDKLSIAFGLAYNTTTLLTNQDCLSTRRTWPRW
jgi:hypothetical protein